MSLTTTAQQFPSDPKDLYAQQMIFYCNPCANPLNSFALMLG